MGAGEHARSPRHEAARYLVAGGVNTAVTYLLLLAALRVLEYRVAYTVVYVAGIAFAYWLQSRYVFGAPLRWRTGLAFPLVYVVQYAAGLAVLWLLVGRFGVPEAWAALAAIAVNVPVGFVLSRALLRPSR